MVKAAHPAINSALPIKPKRSDSFARYKTRDADNIPLWLPPEYWADDPSDEIAHEVHQAEQRRRGNVD